MAGALLTFLGLFVSCLMLIFGLFFIFRGVSNFITVRKISDTPTSKIRSAAIGLVELKGEASPAQSLNSHLTGKPCVFSRLVVEKYSRFKKMWVQVGAFERISRFYLEDASGKVLVDPSKADYDFAFQSSAIEVFLINGGRAATDKAEIAEALARRQSQMSFGPLQDYILGGKESGYGEIMTTTRIISSFSQVDPDSKAPPPGLASALMVNRFLDGDKPTAEGFRLLGPGDVRLTEQTIPAYSTLYVLGSYEAPGSSGKGALHENPRVHKGEEGVLLISDKSEKALSASKTVRALALAGAGIAVAAFSVLVAFLFI